MPVPERTTTVSASKSRTSSPIVKVLNREVERYHRWCTPSILMDQERVEDFYRSDVSVSFGQLGSLLDHTALFGKAERHAAKVLGADRMMFSVHGSSGSNFIVMRMLELVSADTLVLVARNVHHSVINALKLLRVDFRFLPTHFDARFEALLPPSADEVLHALRRFPEAAAVIYTSPTYEGFTASTRLIAQTVHENSDDALVIVDEAWGGHLRFHRDLPVAAMDAGADISLQSSHKLAGGLQQTGTILWKEKKPRGQGRVRTDLMHQAYRDYVTTSPSYHLVASADAAVRGLAASGAAVLDRSIQLTRAFQKALRARLPQVALIDDRTVRGHAPYVAGFDQIKTTCGLARFELTGFFVSDKLVDNGIVIEKAGLNTLTFITTFQLADEAVRATVDALGRILGPSLIPGGKAKKRQQTKDPFELGRQVMHPHDASRYASSVHKEIRLEDAEDEVAVESVEIYPPGIPVIIEGFRVTADAIRYLTNIRETLLTKERPASTVVARDTTLETLRVL